MSLTRFRDRPPPLLQALWIVSFPWIPPESRQPVKCIHEGGEGTSTLPFASPFFSPSPYISFSSFPPPPFFYAFRSFVFTTDEILGQIASRSREDEKGARLRIRRVSIILQKTLALFAERTGTRFFHPLPTESLLNASSNNCRKLVVGYRGMVNSSSFPVE